MSNQRIVSEGAVRLRPVEGLARCAADNYEYDKNRTLVELAISHAHAWGESIWVLFEPHPILFMLLQSRACVKSVTPCYSRVTSRCTEQALIKLTFQMLY
jgi:hypothetical protein